MNSRKKKLAAAAMLFASVFGARKSEALNPQVNTQISKKNNLTVAPPTRKFNKDLLLKIGIPSVAAFLITGGILTWALWPKNKDNKDSIPSKIDDNNEIKQSTIKTNDPKNGNQKKMNIGEFKKQAFEILDSFHDCDPYSIDRDFGNGETVPDNKFKIIKNKLCEENAKYINAIKSDWEDAAKAKNDFSENHIVYLLSFFQNDKGFRNRQFINEEFSNNELVLHYYCAPNVFICSLKIIGNKLIISQYVESIVDNNDGKEYNIPILANTNTKFGDSKFLFELELTKHEKKQFNFCELNN